MSKYSPTRSSKATMFIEKGVETLQTKRRKDNQPHTQGPLRSCEYDLTFQIEIRVIDLSFSLKASVISGRSILCARFLCLPSKFLFGFFLLSVISFKQLKTTIFWVITGYKDIHSSLLVVSHNRANILETRKQWSYFYLLLA
jgi:hypothetical protein